MFESRQIILRDADDFEGWRAAARNLAEAETPPETVVWTVEGGEGDLFAAEMPSPAAPRFPVPRSFVELAKLVICHSDPERFALLYTLLYRLRTERQAMDDEADPLIRRLERLAKEVRRDIHKM